MPTQKEMNERILAAARSGNVDTLRDCINKGAEVNCQDYSYNTPLHHAATNSNAEGVVSLLKSGASPSVVNKQSRTPLHHAANNSNAEVVDLLLKSGASPSVADYMGGTPLQYAAKNSNAEVVVSLLKSGASPSVTNYEGSTPLHHAATNSNAEVVDLLLKSGASPSVADHQGRTPLHFAATNSNAEVVDLLLKSGASPSVADHQDTTPLHFAAENSNAEVVDLLLKSGASPSVSNDLGSTPLHHAATNSNAEVVDLLLKSGASPSVEDHQGGTPLHHAATNSNAEVVDLLLKSGASPSVEDHQSRTPLHHAANNSNAEVVDLLLKSGASPSVADYMGGTPLHHAATNSNAEVVDLLLKSGASPSVEDHQSRTPLHHAANNSNAEVVDLLLKSGASPSVADYMGGTPLQYAAKNSNAEVVDLLLKSGASPSVADHQGGTPLHHAATNSNAEVVDLLLKSGASPSVEDHQGSTPLHYAATNHNTEVVDLLLKSGASPSVADNLDYLMIHDNSLEFDTAPQEESTTFVEDDILKELGLETGNEFKNMLKEGSYACYWNRIYLVGPFGVGKTTLAKNLVGDAIPDMYMSTDGIWIYIGRAGMDTEQRKWVFLNEGTHLNAAVMSMLKTKGSKTSVSEEIHGRYSEDTHANEDPNEHDCHQAHDSSNKLPDTKSDISTESTHIPSDSNNDISDDDIISLVRRECKKGDYNMSIIPIDIWDFGGQKIYYMTHQLFISSMGTYVIVFNGSIDINVEVDNLTFLPGHEGKKTSAAYIMHWVNSILTYCEQSETKEGVLFPRILFVATHKDRVDNVEEQKQLLKASLENLFKHHAGRKHLVSDQLFFINATDKQDKDIEELRQRLLDAAFEHPNWGQPMPTKFVPLELQLAKQSSEGKKVLSMKELENINRKNDDMALTTAQLNLFLKIAHASGKLIHFDDKDLREYVIVDPAYLIEVLRSIVTEKLFWPKSETLREIFEHLSTTGIIYKSGLLSIWEQTECMRICPYKEYMINILVRLDIMIQPKSDVLDNEGNPQPSTDDEYFLVPCMITDRPLPKTFGNDKCIYMSYTFTGHIIPPALLYRFIASFVAMRNINFSKDPKDLILFTDSAVVSIDRDHQVKTHVQDNRLVVTLIHMEDKTRIVPSIAATVQESLARTIERISNFYWAITNTSNYKKIHYPFIIEFGVYCQSQLCFFKHNILSTEIRRTWRCPEHAIDHDTTLQHLWFAEKEPTIRSQCRAHCDGLEVSWLQKCPSDKHLWRIAASLTHTQAKQLYVYFALDDHSSNWDNWEHQHLNRGVSNVNFWALKDWKENAENPTFGKLLSSLKKVPVNTCVLCEVVRDIHLEGILDYSEEMLSWTPSDEALEDLCHEIGSASFQLGIELDLTVVVLQSIEIRHKELITQARAILKTWKSEKCSNKQINYPFKTLAKSLQRIRRKNCINVIKLYFGKN